jgi:hypothetical protein
MFHQNERVNQEGKDMKNMRCNSKREEKEVPSLQGKGSGTCRTLFAAKTDVSM